MQREFWFWALLAMFWVAEWFIDTAADPLGIKEASTNTIQAVLIVGVVIILLMPREKK